MSAYNTLCRWLAASVALPASLVLTGCKPSIAEMTPEEHRRMAPILAKLTPRCVGRYLIDMPKDFVLNPVSKMLIEGVTLDVRPMKKFQFDTALELRRLQIESGKFPQPYLSEVRPVPSAEGVIFNRADGGSSPAIRMWD